MLKKITALAMAVMMVMAFSACGGEAKIEGTLEEITNKIYENAEGFEIGVMNTMVDVADADVVNYALGTSDASDIAEILASDALMMPVSYAMAVVRAEEGADVAKLAERLHNSANAAKWICVTAEKVLTAYCGDVIIVVMGQEANVKLIYDAFNKVADGNASEYLLRAGL